MPTFDNVAVIGASDHRTEVGFQTEGNFNKGVEAVGVQVGVRGVCGEGRGVEGRSTNNDGVAGSTDHSGRSGVIGSNPSGTGVFGNSVAGRGVDGHSDGNYGGYFSIGRGSDPHFIGGLAQMRLEPAPANTNHGPGPPPVPGHFPGEFYVDSQGSLFYATGDRGWVQLA
jgi:hypothetical protein